MHAFQIRPDKYIGLDQRSWTNYILHSAGLSLLHHPKCFGGMDGNHYDQQFGVIQTHVKK